jgi:hypothetical protein
VRLLLLRPGLAVVSRSGAVVGCGGPSVSYFDLNLDCKFDYGYTTEVILWFSLVLFIVYCDRVLILVLCFSVYFK